MSYLRDFVATENPGLPTFFIFAKIFWASKVEVTHS